MKGAFMRTVFVAVLLWALASVPVTAQKSGKSKVEKGEAAWSAVRIDWLMQSPYGDDMSARDGASVRLGGNQGKWVIDKDGAVGFTWGGKRHAVASEGQTLELNVGGRAAGLAVYPDAAGVFHAFAADAMACEVDGLSLLFIDANFNGKFLDHEHDRVAIGPRGAFAFPCAKVLPLIDASYSFKEGKGKLTWVKEEFASTDKARELHNALNKARMDMGLFPAECDAAANAACQAHCEYMHSNDVMTHSQDKKLNGYTKEGDAAARTSVLTRKNTPTGAIGQWLNQPLHGRDLRALWLTKAGFGFYEGFACLRTSGLSGTSFSVTRAAVFPPNDARDVPVTWASGESPEPRQDAGKTPGYPITFSYDWGKPFLPRDLKATMFRKDGAEWKEVAVQVTAPGLNVPASMTGFKYAFVLPVEQLAANTVYRLEIQFQTEDREDGAIRTCFTTGSNSSPRSWNTAQQR